MPIGPTIERLRELGIELPEVGHPMGWGKDPFVVGDPELAKEVYKFNRLYPEAGDYVKKVTLGPTRGSMEQMFRSKLPMDSFGNTSLMGIYRYSGDKNHPAEGGEEIGINPTLRGDVRSQTLGHEMGHALGLADDKLADIFGDQWVREYKRGRRGTR